MKKNILVASTAIILFGIAGIAGWYFYGHRKTVQNISNTPSSAPPAPQVQNPNQTPTVTLYYPITDFANRITFRKFGQLVRSSDPVSPCGVPFSGYHDADDLEVTASEVDADVPVYAIAEGTVRQIGPVSGYGGLLVLGTTINGQTYTIYYGHINLGSTSLVAGSSVKAGERLASLGAQCSSQTGGERKHLHFAIHVGNNIDVRGYVPTLSELAAWTDPQNFLANNSASAI